MANIHRITHNIIALDDQSDDNGALLLKKAGAQIKVLSKSVSFVPMSKKRQWLLELGRQAKGTHFIFLDADEAFTFPFTQNHQSLAANLKPGQSLVMQWLALWKLPNYYRDDNSVLSNNYKDFVYYDDNQSSFTFNLLSEPRTPGNPDSVVRIKPAEGEVFHFQYLDQEYYQIKQAWYRCLELIDQPGRAQTINRRYAFTLDKDRIQLSLVPAGWWKGINLPTSVEGNNNWRLVQILEWFNKYGAGYFEQLDIWHILPLYHYFVSKVGRIPSGSALNKTINRLQPIANGFISKITSKIPNL